MLSNVEGSEETVLPFSAPPRTIPVATAFRSTWISSSLESLRAAGHFERYRALLREHEDAILSCVAGTWLPLAVARAHYLACEELKLTIDQQLTLRRGAGTQIREAWLATFIATAEQKDSTPWTILPLLHRLWVRGVNGGAVGVFRTGPKEARAEYAGCDLFDIPFFRQAVRSLLIVWLEHACDTLAVTILPQQIANECRYQMRWA